MQNNQQSIFEETDRNNTDSFEVMEGNTDNNITTSDEITAGNTNEPTIIPQQETTDGTPTIIESKPIDESNLTQIKFITIKPKGPSNTALLWSWCHENCYQPFYSSFKGQFVAEILQVSISIVPIIMYEVIRRPYIPCQELPESAFLENKKKPKPKTWKQRVFSLETLCVLCLATTVFMAGFLDNDDGHNMNKNNEFRHSRNQYRNTKKGRKQFQQRKYGAYY